MALTQKFLEYFSIPEDLAKELSELLMKQTIRERVLVQLVDQPDKYAATEQMLIPVTTRIETIKKIITEQYVPEKYRSNKFVWNYNGWDMDQNKVQILENVNE